jgi:hypothetical protein
MRQHPAPPHRPRPLLEGILVRDVLARVVYLREAVELGEHALAAAILRDLEDDLAEVLAEVER